MALSLLKTSQNNVSGAVTPNALIYGFFEYNIVGNVTINAPTNVTDGQFLAIRVGEGAVGGHTITWASAFKGALCTGSLGATNGYKAVFFCDSGEATLIGESYF